MARVVNVQAEACDIYVGRARGAFADSDWMSPYVLRFAEDTRSWTIYQRNTLGAWDVVTHTHSRGRAIRTSLELYRIHARRRLKARLPELVGKRLGCWCAPGPCHADALIELLVEYGLDHRDPGPQLGLDIHNHGDARHHEQH